MNTKFIKASLIFISASALFIAGCGPVNDAEYVAQTADSGINADILNKDDQGNAAPAPEAAEAPAPADDGGCPTGDCEIPPDPDTHRAVQLPDQVETEPTKVMPTEEEQLATDIVDYHTTIHRWQPSERHHRVHKHRNLVRRHFTKIVDHPTFRRINSVVTTASQEDQVMPTEQVVEPVVDYGCAGAPEPAPAPAVVIPIVRPVYAFPYLY